jgi:UDP-glucose:(heptosyl)LPS alpha-1,3-glucosyltransferase
MKGAMKIALVIEHFDATRGGAEHLAVWVANELSRRGHDVHVVCHDVTSRVNRYRQATQRASHDADRSYRALPPPEVEHDGLSIHRLRGMRMNTALGFRLFGARARQWCREHQPDVVHSLSVAFAGDIYHAYAGVYAAMQQQAAASRRTEAGSAWKRMMLRLPGKQRTLVTLERRAVAGIGRDPGARRVISLCAMMTRQFAQAYPGCQRKLIELATPRMDLGGSQPLPAEEAARRRAWLRGNYRIAQSERVAVFVGHDFRRKGLRYAIEAIARSRTGWKLMVVGLGKSREYVELADELGIGDATPREKGGGRVLFVGPTREMASVYAAADALLLPTFYEPSGLLVLEAFAHGLPVISTQFLGASELVREHRAGRIVDSPQDVAALAAALDSLPPAGSDQQRSLAARGRAASDGISAEKYLEALLSLYQSVRREKGMR